MRLAEDEYPPPRSTMTGDAPFGQLLEHLQSLGRRPTTLATYRSIYRSHLAWKLDEVPVEKVMRRDIEAIDRAMVRKEKAPKTRVNALKLASEVFSFAKRNGWCRRDPCEEIELPEVEPTTDIRFLEESELVALLEAIDVEEKPFGPTDWRCS